MRIDVVIIENQKEEMECLITELKSWSKEKGIEISISSFSSGEDYFKANQIHKASIYFLDIQLGGMNGVEIAKRLRTEEYKEDIIFLTAFKEYVFEGYQVRALNYLLKPIKKEDLFICMDEVASRFMGNNYFFRNKQEIIQIPYHKILAFSSSLHYVDILAESGSYCQYTSLTEVLNYLPKEFVRVHRSYIVNMRHIYKILGNTITLSNGLKMQIGRRYLNDVRAAFATYSFRFDKQGDSK